MDRTPRLCCSAGHGENSRGPGRDDPGMSKLGPGDEDDFNLGITKNLVADFKVAFAPVPGAYVMLRNGGYYAKADDDARRHGCDTLVESHLDAGGGRANGTSVLYENDGSKPLASRLSLMISRGLGTDNDGAKRRTDLAVLEPVRGDSLKRQVLVEWLYGDSKSDIAKWRANSVKGELAAVNAILLEYGWPTVTKLPRTWGSLSKAVWKARLKRAKVI